MRPRSWLPAGVNLNTAARHGYGRCGADLVIHGELREEIMPLKFIGIDPDTPGGSCPSVWVDESTGDLLFQGGEELDETNRSTIDARSPILPHERIVRIPARMRHIVRHALDNTA
jgi:hypothetical protein